MNKLIEKPISFGGQVVSGKSMHRVRPVFIINDWTDQFIDCVTDDWSGLFELSVDFIVYPHSLYFEKEYKTPEAHSFFSVFKLIYN